MKEKIYTIPINEAFDEGGECPLCNLHQKLEKDTLDFVLGPSYMEEDMREKTNKTGFCKHHYDKMFKAQNRLGVALMVSTHLKKINNDLEKVLEGEMKREKKKSPFKKTEDEPFLYKVCDTVIEENATVGEEGATKENIVVIAKGTVIAPLAVVKE